VWILTVDFLTHIVEMLLYGGIQEKLNMTCLSHTKSVSLTWGKAEEGFFIRECFDQYDKNFKLVECSLLSPPHTGHFGNEKGE
jgi:hypothetical protein